MHEGIFIAASGGLKQQKKLDLIANNLANMNTTSFKADKMLFKAMVPPFGEDTSFDASRNVLLTPDKSNANVSYVGIGKFYTDHSEGPLAQTGNAFDLALEGEGYFKIQTDGGIRYTRNGNFRLNNTGQLITQEGNLVLGLNDQALAIDTKLGEVTIDAGGSVSVGKGLNNASVGKIQVVNFADSAALSKEGNGIYTLTDPNIVEEKSTQVRVRQGFLEGSNVNSVEEMTKMITTLRAYEAYQKVIQAIDDSDEQSVSQIGRVA